MKTCVFFGHGDTPQDVRPPLRAAIIDVIENHGVTNFYVGNHGAFDRFALGALKELAAEYRFTYHVVLAYMPGKKNEFEFETPPPTLLPDGIEDVPPRFAIVHRNRWLVKEADYVITYVNRGWGGAAQFKKLAVNKGKHVIELATPLLPSADEIL